MKRQDYKTPDEVGKVKKWELDFVLFGLVGIGFYLIFKFI